jgi:hypothetical protein
MERLREAARIRSARQRIASAMADVFSASRSNPKFSQRVLAFHAVILNS